MKLRNKKTGEIIETDFDLSISIPDDEKLYGCNTYTQLKGYTSLAELNEEWEDYKEPKESYFIDSQGDIHVWRDAGCDDWSKEKEIGNYFETKEEAEQALRKLKAWKRLKDKGFIFKDYTRKFDGFKRVDGSVFIVAELDDEGVIGMIDELNICFGGEEQ